MSVSKIKTGSQRKGDERPKESSLGWGLRRQVLFHGFESSTANEGRAVSSKISEKMKESLLTERRGCRQP